MRIITERKFGKRSEIFHINSNYLNNEGRIYLDKNNVKLMQREEIYD
jgi:hypothetical protein